MTDHVFQCEGAEIPQQWAAVEQQHSLGHNRDGTLDIDFRLELPAPVLSALPGRARDLVRIAAYCYLADQSISRGGDRDVYLRKWRRTMRMAVEVEEPDFWSSSEVVRALASALHFLTEDEWAFWFSPASTARTSQLQLVATDSSLLGDPQCVVLFSGGADSLCAAVAAHQEGARPLLVSHRPSPLTDSNQRFLVDELRNRFGANAFRHVGAVINHRGSEAADASQRSRSLVFASLGIAVASALNLTDVRLADNGIVSLNLPITDQAIGALASRSTHPKSLRLLTALAQLVAGKPIRVWNPLWNCTRPEALKLLVEANAQDLVSETRSCAHPRGRTNVTPHCGTCSQCVDRRFGMIAADIYEYDIAPRYEVDIFRDDLAEGEPRTIATSYVRLALQLERTPEDAFFSEFPQLYDCIDPASPNLEGEATALVRMLKRHAAAVLSVMEQQITVSAGELVRGSMSEFSLIKLVGSVPRPEAKPVQRKAAEFAHSPDYSSVTFHGESFVLGPNERTVVKLLHEAWGTGTPEVGGPYLLETVDTLARSVSELLRRSKVWATLVVPGERRGTYRLNLTEG